jgi:hypothetical protein
MSFFNYICTSARGAVTNYIGATYENVRASLAETRICRFAQSKLGKMAMRATGENIAEWAGYTLGLSLATPTCVNLGQKTFRWLAGSMAVAVSAGIGTAMTWLVGKASSNLSPNQQKMSMLVAFALATSGALRNFLNKALELGQNTGELVGHLAAYSIGLGTAFLGMKLFDTEEFMWDPDRIMQSYLFKTLQSMLFCALLEHKELLPSNWMANGLTSLAIGSLAYNILDLKELAKDIHQGRLLDGALPKNPCKKIKPLNENCFAQASSVIIETQLEGLSKQLSKHGEKQVVSAATALVGDQEKMDILHACKKVIKPIFSVSSFEKEMEKHLINIIKDQTIQILDEMGLYKAISELHHVSVTNTFLQERGLALITSSTNLYFLLKKERPELFQNLDPNDVRIEPLCRRLLVSPDALNLIATELNRHNPQLAVTPDALAEKIHHLSRLVPQIPTHMMEIAKNNLLEAINQIERSTIGFNLIPEEQKRQLVLEIQSMILWSVITTPLTVYRLTTPLSDEELRSFYCNLSDLMCRHLISQGSLGNIVSNTLKSQLSHSELS